MSKKRAGRQKFPRALPTSRRPAAVIISAAVMLSLAAGILARWVGPRPAARMNVATTPAGLSPASPSKEYVYAGGRLLATEAPGGPSTLSAPGNLVATTASDSRIDLTWAASASTVDHYQV